MINENNTTPSSVPASPEASLGERGVPGITRTKRKSPLRMLPIVIGLVLVLLFGAVAVGLAIKRWSAQQHAQTLAARVDAAKDKPSDAPRTRQSRFAPLSGRRAPGQGTTPASY